MAEINKKDDEPSIEEILDSIRQIISEDDDMAEMDNEVRTEVKKEIEIDSIRTESERIDQVDVFDSVADITEEEEDVFELTDLVDENSIDDGDSNDMVEVDFVDPDSFSTDDLNEDEASVEPEPEPIKEEIVNKPQPKALPQKEDDDSLLSDKTRDAAFDAMAALVRKTAVEHNGITLEDIVRAELKPLLKAWLDKNLPIVIERLVREELERVSKRVMDE